MPRPTARILASIVCIPLGLALSGCGAVFVNPGSKNASLADAIPNPNAGKKAKKADLGKAFCVFVDDGVGALYPYGGANGAMSDDEVYSGKTALKCSLNGADYSGIIVDSGQLTDLKAARDNGAVLRFYTKGDTGGEPIFISITDGKDDNKEVEVFVDFAKYGPVATEWKEARIPLKDFPDNGGYWDGSKMNDGVPIDWTKIQEFRVKDNRSGRGLYAVYVDEAAVIPAN
jgi:hypothetical protein